MSPYLYIRVPIFGVLAIQFHAKNVNSVSGQDILWGWLASSQVHLRCKECIVNRKVWFVITGLLYLYVDNEVFLPVSAWKSFLIKNLFSLLLAGIKSTRCQGNHNFVLCLEHKNQNFTLKS